MPRPVGGIATKSTFINGFRSPIFTARIGADFNHRVIIGAGVSWLKLSRYDPDRTNAPFYLDKYFSDSLGSYLVHPALNFRYVNAFFEYVYHRSRKWQFSVPMQVGAGDSWYSYSFNGVTVKQDGHFILLYEPAVSGQYKVLKWLAVGLDVGYRIMIVSNKNIGSKFDSPMYDIKALLLWGELYRMVFPKRKS